jgi:hypothetical protein
MQKGLNVAIVILLIKNGFMLEEATHNKIILYVGAQ